MVKETVPFGCKGMSDFTLHKDPERKQRYILRHQKTENWRDPTTSGFFSRWLLWNTPTLKQSVDDLNKRFKTINFFLRR